MEQKIDFTILDQAISEFGNQEKALIAILQRAQEHYRYLPKEIFPYLADKLNIPEARIFGVATFYENFSFEPKGKYVIKVCDGTACHVRKSLSILERLYQDLGLSKDKHTTDDMLFTVETVSCLGACGLAPVLMVNDDVYPAMTPEAVTQLLNKLKAEA